MFRLPVRPDVELLIMEDSQAPEIFAVVDRNREYLRRWLPWVDQAKAPEDIAAFIRRGTEQYAARNGWHCGVWWEGAFTGGVGLKPINWPDSKVEIGYWLSEAAQGHGLITDACRAAIRHIFVELGLNRVEIRVAAGNQRSAAVALRLGATLEGIEREGSSLHGRFVDMQRFAVLRRDFPCG